MKTRMTSRRSSGFVLFEVMLALIIFAIAVVGLARALNDTIGVTNSMNQERAIRMALESFLNEVRAKESTSEMNTEIVDTQRGISFMSAVEKSEVSNAEGNTLDDLYILTGTAKWGNGTEETTAQIMIYKPGGGAR